MSEVWQVQLKSLAGALTNIVDAYDSFTYTKRVNSTGGWALRYAKHANETQTAFETRCGLWVLDAQVEFWQTNDTPVIAWRKDFEGLVRWQRWYVRVDGALVFEVGGRGYNDLLARRIVYAAAGSTHAAWSSAAETAMKDVADYQCGPSAAVARQTTGLTIEADAAGGNTITLKRAYRNVLEVLQEMAVLGDGDFAVVGTGAATYEFRYYNGQLGTDRSATVIFALERGNMASPSLSISRQDEVNVAYVGGQGEGAERAIVERSDAGLIADSTWNRCERFVHATNETTTAGLNSAGDRALDEGKPKYELSFNTLQTPGCMYGLHYFLGDLVTARFLNYSATKKIAGVSITLNESGMSETSKTVETEDA